MEGVGVGEAGGVADGAGAGDALGLAGDCAAKSAAALQTPRMKMKREARRHIRGPILSRNRAKSNIPAVMAAVEMDLRDRLIGSVPGCGHAIAQCCHRQNATASRNN